MENLFVFLIWLFLLKNHINDFPPSSITIRLASYFSANALIVSFISFPSFFSFPTPKTQFRTR